MDIFALCYKKLIFATDGLITAGAINTPGSIQDCMLAKWGEIYNLLNQNYARNQGRCIMDSAFARNKNLAII